MQYYNGVEWVSIGGGGDSLYTADGQLSGDRNIDPNGSGLTLIDSSGPGAYFDFHSFKGTGGWSIGTDFNSLTVDWLQKRQALEETQEGKLEHH